MAGHEAAHAVPTGAQVAEQEAGPAAPIATDAAARLASLDFIRGLALLGIVIPNMTGFAQPFGAYFWPPLLEHGAGPADKAIWLAQFVLVDGKFRGLFTLLFGAGMALFMERAWARGADRRLQLHRLLWLLLFGLVHYFLIWRGDILTLYATWGIVALPLLRRPAGQLLALGLAIYLAGSLVAFVSGASAYRGGGAHFDEIARNRAAPALERRIRDDAAHEAAVMGGASYERVVTDKFELRASALVDMVLDNGAETLGLILMGIALYRFGLFSDVVPRSQLLFWGWTGVATGTLVTIPYGLWTWARDFPLPLTLFVFNDAVEVPHLPVVLGLAALLCAWSRRAGSGWLGRRLAAVGRMPLTNYLGTSLVMVVLFQGWGLGLFGRFDRPGLVGFAILAWLAMLAWSRPWLDRFRFGPLEWLWRCLTYNRLLPIRRR